MITTNIHHVTAISMERVDFGSFISHKFVFMTEDGERVEIDAFASESLDLAMKPQRSTLVCEKDEL